MTLALIQCPDERLLTPCEVLPEITPEVLTQIKEMFSIMRASKGVGLAANQVGLTSRIFITEMDGKAKVFINPEILETRGLVDSKEGCLSQPGKTFKVKRAREVRVRAKNKEGKMFQGWVGGPLAICIQHEMDHLDGILIGPTK